MDAHIVIRMGPFRGPYPLSQRKRLVGISGKHHLIAHFLKPLLHLQRDGEVQRLFIYAPSDASVVRAAVSRVQRHQNLRRFFYKARGRSRIIAVLASDQAETLIHRLRQHRQRPCRERAFSRRLLHVGF